MAVTDERISLTSDEGTFTHKEDVLLQRRAYGVYKPLTIRNTKIAYPGPFGPNA
jgi:hypothetical protein